MPVPSVERIVELHHAGGKAVAPLGARHRSAAHRQRALRKPGEAFDHTRGIGRLPHLGQPKREFARQDDGSGDGGDGGDTDDGGEDDSD